MSKTKAIVFSNLVVFENKDYFLINKPPFVSTLEDRVATVNILALARQAEPDAQVCHRLDKDTSGLLAIARHAEAYRQLSMQFEHRTVKKTYHAVVDGCHDMQHVEVEARIFKQSDGTVKLSSKGKDASTSFLTLNVFLRHSLIECRPVTGRMHQIRIHLLESGHHVIGDKIYGPDEAYYLEFIA